MKQTIKKSIIGWLTFFFTILFLTIWYAAINIIWTDTSSLEVSETSTLKSENWNKLLWNFEFLNLKLKQDCWAWKYLQWFDINWDKICVNLPVWVDVPFTDTADFDVNCEYRYKILYTVDDSNRKRSNSTFSWGYISTVSPKFLWTVLSWTYYFWIPSSLKWSYWYRDMDWLYTNSPNATLEKLEKRCN